VPAKKGMNRYVWDLKFPKLDVVKGAVMSLGYTGGHRVVPGTYQVRLTVGESTETRSFQVLKDPRLEDVSQEDLMRQFELVSQVRDKVTEIHNAIRTIRSLREQLTGVVELAKKAGFEDFRQGADAISGSSPRSKKS